MTRFGGDEDVAAAHPHTVGGLYRAPLDDPVTD